MAEPPATQWSPQRAMVRAHIRVQDRLKSLGSRLSLWCRPSLGWASESAPYAALSLVCKWYGDFPSSMVSNSAPLVGSNPLFSDLGIGPP